MENGNSTSVHFRRQDCLKQIFQQARHRVCLYTRIERTNKERVKRCFDDISNFLRKQDRRFEKVFIKCTGKYTFNAYWELNLGNENKSMYLHKGCVAVTAVCLEAESKEIWKDEIVNKNGVNYLSAHAMNLLLHMRLSKALREYSKNNKWKERMDEMKLHSIGLEEICKVHLYFNNELNMKKKDITVNIIPTIKIHDYCMPYAKQWFGDKITHFIAQPKHTFANINPSLQWTSSYHEQEQITMTTFPTKIALESFYGVLLITYSDPVLKLLSRDIVMHVFLETTNHMGRWMEMNFGDDQHFKKGDHDAMMESFFRKLRQKLESNFSPNHFNPEINLLEMHGLDFNEIGLIINKLKSILRGNCECCRDLLQQSLDEFKEENIKKKKKKKRKL